METFVKLCCVGGLLAAIAILLISCNDKPEIFRAYDFSLTHWYLPSSIKTGEAVEIRFTLHRQGKYADAVFYLGYIQLKGKGEVFDTEGRNLVNREYHLLADMPDLRENAQGDQTFTLYYRNMDSKNAELKFVVMDNFGQEHALTVPFGVDTQTE